MSDKTKKILIVVFAGMACISITGLIVMGFTIEQLSGVVVGLGAAVAAVTAVIAVVLKWIKG